MPRLVVPIFSPELAFSRVASSSRWRLRISGALSAIRRMSGVILTPWPLSFSYGRAMQQAALKLWAKDMKGNYAAAQKTVFERAKDNGLAALGKWNG